MKLRRLSQLFIFLCRTLYIHSTAKGTTSETKWAPAVLQVSSDSTCARSSAETNPRKISKLHGKPVSTLAGMEALQNESMFNNAALAPGKGCIAKEYLRSFSLVVEFRLGASLWSKKYKNTPSKPSPRSRRSKPSCSKPSRVT